MIIASIPSPGQGVWDLGPLPVRAYALCILLGVVVAISVADRRWVARGGAAGTMGDIAIWAVPFGLVGARAYHVVTDPELYFGAGRDPWEALAIWKGGLGVWGAIAGGCLGGYFAARRKGIPFPAIADAAAPGIVLAQAIGRLGNYFNQELYGRPSTLPWAVEIDPAHREDGLRQYATYQPTFLYELLWDLGVAGLVIWADRRFRLGHGRAFALYVMAYTAGRGWIEYLRVDTAHHFLGLRLNLWTSIVLFVLAAAYFVIVGRLRPGREDVAAQPMDATLADAASTDAAPTDATLTDGGPSEPVLTEPVLTEAVPTDPVPTDPVPTDPAPTDPVPTDPVPTEGVPADPVGEAEAIER